MSAGLRVLPAPAGAVRGGAGQALHVGTVVDGDGVLGLRGGAAGGIGGAGSGAAGGEADVATAFRGGLRADLNLGGDGRAKSAARPVNRQAAAVLLRTMRLPQESVVFVKRGFCPRNQRARLAPAGVGGLAGRLCVAASASRRAA
ncbi:hypothetical protein Ddc_23685 [Ditylenchus destructor]|nr:hypothetical protein Ddc_23685 [Ditylenchus destructor]